MSSLFFLISWLSNAFFVFITLALVTQGILRLLRVKSYRLRACARMIPGVALLFMPLLQFLKIGQFLNPLSCDGWLQKLIIYFFPGMKNILTIPKEMVLNQYSHFEPFNSAISILFCLFITTTIIVFLGRVFQLCWTSYQLRRLIREAEEYSLPIQNPWLASQIKRHRVRVFVSDLIQIPMAIESRTILVSQAALELLKPDEFESVVTHELAHLLAKDPWVRVFHQLLRSFFWWIPMKTWFKKIEEDQEIACDQTAQQCQQGIASALVKMAGFTRDREKLLSAAYCKLTSQSPFLLVRLELILGLNRFQNSKVWRGVVPLMAGPLILLSCTM